MHARRYLHIATAVAVGATTLAVLTLGGSRPPAGAGAPPTGTITSSSVYSPAVKGRINYEIYLPAAYSASRVRYPSLYLLHGRGDSMQAWTREKTDLDTLIAAYDGRPQPRRCGRIHRRRQPARAALTPVAGVR